MEFFELKKELDNNKLRKVYFFTGEEKGLRDKYIQRICTRTPIKVNSFSNIKDRLLSKNLFNSTSDFYIVDNDKSFLSYENSLSDLEKSVGKNVLIFIYDNLDMRNNFFKTYANYFFHFNKLNSDQLCGYVQNSINVSKELAVTLSEFCHNDFNTIDLEMDKLKNLKEPITFELITELIEDSFVESDFTFLDNISKRDIEKTLDFANNTKASDALKYIGSLYSRFRSLFVVQSFSHLPNIEVAGKTGLTLFVVEKLRAVIDHYTFEELIRNLRLIQQTEVDIKTGRIEALLGFHYLICRILSKNLVDF